MITSEAVSLYFVRMLGIEKRLSHFEYRIERQQIGYDDFGQQRAAQLRHGIDYSCHISVVMLMRAFVHVIGLDSKNILILIVDSYKR